MPDSLDVNVERMWDGKDQNTDVVCSIRLRFIGTDFNWIIPSADGDELFKAVRPALQDEAERNFGKGIVGVRKVWVRKGSLDLLVDIVAVGGPTFMFFKEYDKLRANTLIFSQDVSAMATQLLKVAKNTCRRIIQLRGQNRNMNPPLTH
jgi:hypothetical protein